MEATVKAAYDELKQMYSIIFKAVIGTCCAEGPEVSLLDLSYWTTRRNTFDVPADKDILVVKTPYESCSSLFYRVKISRSMTDAEALDTSMPLLTMMVPLLAADINRLSFEKLRETLDEHYQFRRQYTLIPYEELSIQEAKIIRTALKRSYIFLDFLQGITLKVLTMFGAPVEALWVSAHMIHFRSFGDEDEDDLPETMKEPYVSKICRYGFTNMNDYIKIVDRMND